MPIAEIGWTPTTLKSLVHAIDETLTMTPKASLDDTEIEDEWAEARTWSNQVHELLKKPQEAFNPKEVPPFPLTAEQLLALDASIERIAQARAAATNKHHQGNAAHILKSFQGIARSSFSIGALLVISFAFAVAALIMLIIQNQGFTDGWSFYLTLLSIAVVVALAALIAWGWHIRSLNQHKDALHQAGHSGITLRLRG
jgi:hypothetical protein